MEIQSLDAIMMRMKNKMITESKVKKTTGSGQHIWTDVAEAHLNDAQINDGSEVIVTSKRGKIVIQKKGTSLFDRIKKFIGL